MACIPLGPSSPGCPWNRKKVGTGLVTIRIKKDSVDCSLRILAQGKNTVKKKA